MADGIIQFLKEQHPYLFSNYLLTDQIVVSHILIKVVIDELDTGFNTWHVKSFGVWDKL